MRLVSRAIALSAIVATSLVSLSALAQTDQERAAARALAESGISLQSSGHYLEALDKLERAQKLVDAPPHLLHIAQCQVQLGRLVEASETYRKLERVTLGPTSPGAFKKAQADGKVELAALMPRIPMLTIRVEPSAAKDPVVKIDGTAISPVLVGVEQPINPGDHLVEVSASGFSATTVKVSIQAGAKRTETVTIAASAGAIAQKPSGVETKEIPTNGEAPAPAKNASSAEAPKASPAQEEKDPKESTYHNHDGFFLRVALGGASSNDTLSYSSNGNTTDAGKVTGGSLAFELSIGSTLLPGLVIGGSAIGHSLSGAKYTAPTGATGSMGSNSTATLIGLLADYYPIPSGGFHFGAVLGESSVDYALDSESAKQYGRDSISSTGFGWAAHVGYDTWIARQWSVGILARYYNTTVESGAMTINNADTKVKSTISMPSLLIGVTYH